MSAAFTYRQRMDISCCGNKTSFSRPGHIYHSDVLRLFSLAKTIVYHCNNVPVCINTSIYYNVPLYILQRTINGNSVTVYQYVYMLIYTIAYHCNSVTAYQYVYMLVYAIAYHCNSVPVCIHNSIYYSVPL